MTIDGAPEVESSNTVLHFIHLRGEIGIWMLAQPCLLAYVMHFTKWKAAHLIQIILNAEIVEEY